MNKKISSEKMWTVLVGTALILICQSTTHLNAAPAVPSPSTDTPHYVGFLKVYSTTEQRTDGEDTYRYIHTNYKIIPTDGTKARWVSNETFPLDEDPNKVTLPKGHYVIEAQSELYGFVRIPVFIKTGRTVSLHLERKKDWDQDLSWVKKSDLIKLPTGEIVGIYE